MGRRRARPAHADGVGASRQVVEVIGPPAIGLGLLAGAERQRRAGLRARHAPWMREWLSTFGSAAIWTVRSRFSRP